MPSMPLPDVPLCRETYRRICYHFANIGRNWDSLTPKERAFQLKIIKELDRRANKCAHRPALIYTK